VSRKLYRLLLLLLCVAGSYRSSATHIYGGELLYTYVSANKYLVTLTVYGDCSADSAIFHSLYSAAPIVDVYNSGLYYGSITLKATLLGLEVSPVCPAQLHNTSCNGGTLPGVKKFVYSDTIILPEKSLDWQFIFGGNMGGLGSIQAGRSNHITNVLNAGTTVMQIEADLNDSTGNNSSPVYSAVPTPFYCINQLEQYSQGAIDPDGDSLAFELVNAIDANGGSSVNYRSPFTGSKPVSTAVGNFLFDPLNGQVTFTPDVVQDALVVCRVSEYRKGVLIGTSEREMTFVVLNNCNNTPPAVTLQDVSTGRVTGNNVINICVGTSNLRFDLGFSNPEGSDITLSNSTLPGASTLNIGGNNTPTPSASFEWVTGSVPSGIYTFYLTLQTDHCPIEDKQTIAYTINIASVPQLSIQTLLSTECVHDAYVEYDIKYGFPPRTLNVMEGSALYKSYIDTTGVVRDSLPVGVFIAIVSSDTLCAATQTYTVKDSGTLPLAPIIRNYCIDVPDSVIDVEPIRPGALINWYNLNLSPAYFAPVPNTKKVGTQTWFFTEQYRVCSSGYVPVIATVHALPAAQIISIPPTICLGDTIYLAGAGGVTYVWSPQNEILNDSVTGRLYIRVLVPTTIQLNVTDEYGCTDSTYASYKNIEYCCTFSYPNAFTPNGDGKNDGFKVITFGNMMNYHLMIFNRWGQMVFETFDPEAYWTGKFKGLPCDIGTYFFYFKGQCLTGRVEESKGDVILIR